MKVRRESNLQRIVVLSALLIGAAVLVIMPRGLGGSAFILSVSVLSGLIAGTLFFKSSVSKIKNLAEQMSNEYQAKSETLSSIEQDIGDYEDQTFRS